jgi:hypothetical protein
MRAHLLTLSLLSLALGCMPDDEKDTDSGAEEADADADSDADADADSDADADADADDTSIVGEWLSEGDDISLLFQSGLFDYEKIEARFESDASYLVVATTGGGDVYELVGTYTTDTGTTPHTIVLSQSTPYEATAEGIWQISGTTMQYEVAQIDPNPAGIVAPTPGAGFGSTTGGGINAGQNVQIYQRQ